MSLEAPTAPITATPVPPEHTSTLAMPRRRTTRREDRIHRVHHERDHNSDAIEDDHLTTLDDILTNPPTTYDSLPPF